MGVRFAGIKPFKPNRLKAGTQILLPIWNTAGGNVGTFTEGDSILIEFDVTKATSVQLLSGDIPGGTRFETAPLSVQGNKTYIPGGGVQTDFEFTLRATNNKGFVDRTFTITMLPNGDKWFNFWDNTSISTQSIDQGATDSATTTVSQLETNKWFSWDNTSVSTQSVDQGASNPATTTVNQLETNKWFSWDNTSISTQSVDQGATDSATTTVNQLETNKWWTSWDNTSLSTQSVDQGITDSATTEVDQLETNKWWTSWDNTSVSTQTADQSGSGTADL
jgi:hypothetical protein